MTPKPSTTLTLVLSLVLLTPPMARPFGLPTVTIHIINGLPPSKHALTIHCQSGDDDLGVRKVPRGKEFRWQFQRHMLGKTLFHCSFWWNYKEIINYDVFPEYYAWLDYGNNFRYKVTEDGVFYKSRKTELMDDSWNPSVEWGYDGRLAPPSPLNPDLCC